MGKFPVTAKFLDRKEQFLYTKSKKIISFQRVLRTNVGRKMAPKDLHILIFGTCDDVTLQDRRD